MYLSEQSIATNGSQALTVPAGAKAALIEPRGGNFSYRLSGEDAVKASWYSITASQKIMFEGTDLAKFRAIRETDGSGTLYITYFDRVPLKQNYDWDT